MLKVFLTFDVEIWCHGWNNLDARFPDYFKRYLYGPTSSGDFALPLTLSVLRDHGLRGSFFVEPLFSLRFGREPLKEIVDLIVSAGQEIQLHLHTEWLDEMPEPLLRDVAIKRRYLTDFSLGDQQTLLSTGLRLLEQAGVHGITAFRAGSFGMNRDTLKALAANGVFIDTSYNQCHTPWRWDNGQAVLHQPTVIDGVTEYPVTVFRDYPGHLRPAHLSACSFLELQRLLWGALKHGFDSVVIVSHGTELMNQEKTGPDPVVYRRYVRLCRFLERHANEFVVRGFRGLARPNAVDRQPAPLASSPVWTLLRVGEQLWRARYG